ncbi:O-antigen ligase family protein [Kordia sp. YSTF-M3]|uniref:O-antigen ligase family protein n=1 Tax=Kordia aestuariivivens TaxID=2759037 RepID=A0ABR7Q9V5_9FLAO|nr:O-antigen ligase family protein [Kordia aestuariivivens]MBC8755334.1 O-antigen ligase family protein [Kordia aestuariivivens]
MQLKTHATEYLQKNNIDFVFVLLIGVVTTFTLDKINPIFIFSLMIIQGITLFRPDEKIKFKTTPYFWLLMALYGLNIVGMLYTEDISRGFNTITRQISFVLFPLFYSVYRVQNIGLLLKLFVISVFGFVLTFELHTLYLFFYKSDIFPLDLELFFSYRYTGGELTKLLEMHNAYFGMYIMFAHVIILDYLSRARKNYIIILLLLLIAFQSLFLLQMVAKTAIILNIVLIVCSLAYILIKRKLYKTLLFSIGLLAFAGWFSVQHLNITVSRISDRLTELQKGDNSEQETRPRMWSASIPVVKDNYIIGTGTGDVKRELHAEYRKRGINIRSNVHNQYIDYLMRFGIFGLVLFLAVFAYSLIHAIKTNNYIYFCFTIIIMICCFTENILSRQWGITFYAAFNYLLYYQYQKE